MFIQQAHKIMQRNGMVALGLGQPHQFLNLPRVQLELLQQQVRDHPPLGLVAVIIGQTDLDHQYGGGQLDGMFGLGRGVFGGE